MHHILSNYAVSVSELRKNPSELIKKSGGVTITVLNRNVPSAYLVSPEQYEHMLELLDDLQLQETAKYRLKDRSNAIEVDVDDL